ncbi:hypothetical protein TBLA_0D03580 [Henningerozyma blattae CBS 6284]|uniref:Phospholipase A-2-activating protein n=1 Tax=Henningerozyma blattae (strain ATCC 34711 / CBS 6284 / DSM 70876 / NBRC 10599 / NRRL Y-10934 / UCD 77-7) TaxID=1071380 RepID=I2H3A6_HENB6|nr:hypothetical protein TBLA_0D03580 [Tetrapisispora blattae CBS 6284]CCH60858.1 hypothetical protein TBLA_0D03580 [Tetrapisispora blattae CBS 6284]
MYQLSATLKGHTGDVRDVVVLNDEQIGSVSRDGSLRLWDKEGAQQQWDSKILYTGKEFLNSITFDSKEGVLYFGGKSKLIQGCSVFGSLGSEPLYTLIGHENNVCSLEYQNGKIISGSWDMTGRVWENGILKWVLRGHKASVWDVKELPGGKGDRFVTVSADGSIKIWQGEECVKNITSVHKDVIRHVEVLQGEEGNDVELITCSNDGSMKVIDLDGRVKQAMQGHESFVYCVRKMPGGGYVSCGEDRSVIVWSREGQIVQVIRVPAISVWSVDVMKNGDLVIGCSDNTLRVFSEEKSRIAPEEELKQFGEEISGSSLNKESIDEKQLSEPERLAMPGKKEGEVIVVKSASGIVEAYQYSQGEWNKVGEVVGSDSSVSDKKVEYEGKKYDYVFDVDVEEGKPPLKLAVNVSDNVYEVADKFIERNELPLSYRDQIVDFILQNTQGMRLETQGMQSGTQEMQSGAHQMKVLPVKEYLKLDKYNKENLFNGIIKLNSKEEEGRGKFDDGELAGILEKLDDLQGNCEFLSTMAQRMKRDWKVKVPGYDIMRLIVRYCRDENVISEFIRDGLRSENISVVMLTLRMITNCFGNSQLGGMFLRSKLQELNVLQLEYQGSTIAQSKMFSIALSSVLFNYSVMNDESTGIVMIMEILNKFGELEEFQDCEETCYRMMMTYGNLSVQEGSLGTMRVGWVEMIKAKYGKVGRFVDVIEDLRGAEGAGVGVGV